MNPHDILSALDLPPESRVDQRVTKKLFVEKGAPTAADKRRINEGVEELYWLATLKPNTIGVPEYRDTVREYLEIVVLSTTLRPHAKVTRLTELIHRAIPYPLILIAMQTNTPTLSLAHKRWAQRESGKVVLDDSIVTCVLEDNALLSVFLKALAIQSQPRMNLYALYQGWIACLQAYLAARITGRFSLASGPEAVKARQEALAVAADLEQKIALLRAQSGKEKQLPRRVELNLEIQRLESERAKVSQNL